MTFASGLLSLSLLRVRPLGFACSSASINDSESVLHCNSMPDNETFMLTSDPPFPWLSVSILHVSIVLVSASSDTVSLVWRASKMGFLERALFLRFDNGLPSWGVWGSLTQELVVEEIEDQLVLDEGEMECI